MISTLAMTLVLSCAKPSRPYPHPLPVPQVTSSCEGADRVVRTLDGAELQRFTNQCTVARCEGADFVRRTFDGYAVQRLAWSPSCMRAACEWGDLVRRDANGREVSRWRDPNRCGAPQPAAPEGVRFGLTSRG